MTRDTAAECFNCGAPAIDTSGGGYLCEDCRPGGKGDDSDEDTRKDDATPGYDGDKPGSSLLENTGKSQDRIDAALAAFADAIAFFHDLLDDPMGIGDGRTAREYLREERGFSDETIDEARLGWAPASETTLLNHLMEQGHDQEAILGTGLFYEGLNPHFRGRIVFPYFDADGTPAYAIARAVDHPEDHIDAGQKYIKAVKTKEYSAVDEPIFGLDSLRDGEPVIITEGVVDAIKAHDAGYPCVSPVTTSFKDDAWNDLLAAFDAHDVPRAYLLQDAELPSSELIEDEEGWDALNLTRLGEGLQGAVRTAQHLVDEVEVYIADLPHPGAEKVDLDDYLTGWAETVDPILASAVPAEEHPAYRAPEKREPSDCEDLPERERDSEGSAVFALDLPDVAGVGPGYRGTNPLGHHGDSENYFIVTEDGLGYDHKYKTTYNGLTYLLVEAGERSANAPEGRLDDAELFAAWHEAKDNRLIPEDDPVPYRGLVGIAVADGLLDRDDLVEREGADGGTYTGFPDGDAYNSALAHVREEYGVDPGRGEVENDSRGRPDPRTVDVVVEPERAWRAARLVDPGDLDTDASDLDLEETGEGWRCPSCGNAVDVVRAAAIDRHLVAGCSDPLGEEYGDAYRHARETYGAPLPRYVTAADAAARWDVVLGAIREVNFNHLDRDALRVDVTGEGDAVSGDAVLTLDPSPVDGWRDSESGESVLVFESGTVWDADTETTIDALRFVALDRGLLDGPTDDLQGEAFREAYRLARTEYGAPLPRWELGDPDVTPMLPPAEDLVDDPTPDIDELQRARDAVEELYRELAAEADAPHLLRVLPALGKTTSAVKTASTIPTSYLAPRKELMEQAAEKADKHGVTWRHLPIFSEATVREEVLHGAVEHVREEGKDRLRDRWAMQAEIEGDLFKDGEPADGEEEVHLDRPTCATAEGAHGDAWALAVHVARQLDYTPRDIHQRAHALFGSDLPCQEDGDCSYSAGWDAVADPDEPVDLLIGHYIHANVESVRTHYSRTADGSVDRDTRTVVLDEFVGDIFTEEFGDEVLDHATWLASALREDVDDRQDLLERDLWSDEFVRAWIAGEAAAEDHAAHDTAKALGARQRVDEAVTTAREVTDEYDDLLDTFDLEDPLHRLATSSGLDSGERSTIATTVADRIDEVPPTTDGYSVLRWIHDDVVEPLLETVGESTTVEVEALPIGGELRRFVETAVDAAERNRENAAGMLESARIALGGGDAGARELAVWADDGYAHRLAHRLLEAVIIPGDHDRTTRVETAQFAYDPEADAGTVLKRARDRGGIDGGGGAVVLDRNHHGATVLDPPARTAGNGEDAPLVALDATGREGLWSLVLGEEVDMADIHDTPQERATFLRDVMQLQIVRTSDLMRPYEGDPSGKDLDGDVALVERIAEEYAGVVAPRKRGEAAATIGRPAVITTKCVRDVLEDDDRLDGEVAAWENYGNLTGANDLGEHTLAALLGTQHYGDAAVERMAALAGEEVTRTGRGSRLDYGSEVANAYLKHMREDQVMQAALRFARGESGATVFVRTGALREDLPVVGQGQVVKSWSETATAIARKWRSQPDDEFTVSDVVDAVDVKRRQVRRVLAEFVEADYLECHDPGEGLANRYAASGDLGAGEVELPDEVQPEGVTAPDDPPLEQSYTWNVRVDCSETGTDCVPRAPMTSVPAPPPDTDPPDRGVTGG